MSNRTAQSNKAVLLAWENERDLVDEGKGTRDWTRQQQEDILNRGRAYDENGKAFEGHHMKSVEEHSDFQGDPGNIQFLSRAEHKAAHGGDFHNPTNGYYDPITGITKQFGDNKYEPCRVIELSDPIKRVVEDIIDETKSARETEAKAELPDTQKEELVIETNEKENKKQEFNRKKVDADKKQKNTKIYKKNTVNEVVSKAKKVGGNVVGAVKKYWWVIPIVGAAVRYARLNAENRSPDDYDDTGDNGFFINTGDPKIEHEKDKPEKEREENLKKGLEEELNEELEKGQEKGQEREGTHASPKKHKVKAHGQHYGKEKIWIEKEAYERGGKNENI